MKPRLPRWRRRHPIPVSDAGLQPERTAMSWTRTSLAMLVASMTLLRWSSEYPELVVVAIGLLVTIGVTIMALNRPLYRTQAVALRDNHAPPNVKTVLLTTVMMMILGGIGLYLVLTA